MFYNLGTSAEVIKLFSCSTHMCMKNVLAINAITNIRSFNKKVATFVCSMVFIRITNFMLMIL